MQLLAGKRIVVTGSSRGLGRAFAVAVAAHGARVVVNGTNREALAETVAIIEAAGGVVAPVPGSVADDEVARRIVETCVERWGGVDVTVNNAAIVRDRTLMKMTPEEFDEVIAVNLRGTWSVSRHSALAMRETGGLLLQIVSIGAFIGSVGQTNYAASKAGVLGMMYAWNQELRSYGIRVNALSPGAATDMSEAYFALVRRRAAKKDKPAPTPHEMGFGTPGEIAPLVVHLCSDRAAHLRSQLMTFNGRSLQLWAHPHGGVTVTRDRWSLDDLAREFPPEQYPVATMERPKF